MIGLEIQAPEAPAKLLKQLGRNANIAMSLALLRCAQRTESDVKETIRRVFEPGTGNLSRSFKPVMLENTEEEITAGVVSDLVYAGIQNDGGTILPKTAKNLAIPVSSNVPLGKWPRDYPKDALEFVPAKNKGPNVSGYLLDAVSKKPMFRLQRKSVIKPTNYLEYAERISSEHYQDIINTELEELLAASQKAAKK